MPPCKARRTEAALQQCLPRLCERTLLPAYPTRTLLYIQAHFLLPLWMCSNFPHWHPNSCWSLLLVCSVRAQLNRSGLLHKPSTDSPYRSVLTPLLGILSLHFYINVPAYTSSRTSLGHLLCLPHFVQDHVFTHTGSSW